MKRLPTLVATSLLLAPLGFGQDAPAPEVADPPASAESPSEAPDLPTTDDPAPESADDPKPEDSPEEPKPEEKPAEETPDPAAKSDDRPSDLDPDDTGYAQIEVLARAIELIRQSYVDPDKVSYEDLVTDALEGMLAGLDPHCQYMHPKLVKDFQRSQSSSYEGVGITIAPKPGVLTIVSVREDGPAAKAGVLPGDLILQIGEQLTESLSLAESVQLLAGEPGEPLDLTLRTPETGEIKQVAMVRQVIQRETVKDGMILPTEIAGEDLKIGYVRLLQFNEPTASELAEALDQLEDEGMEALVLDLRNNPGGLLNSAIDILGEFLPANTLVLTTEGRVAAQNDPPYRTPQRQRPHRTYPVTILVNHGSASATEVVSGALQDLKRAVIVGETTFGKGSVQSVIPMGDGAAMRLTIAKYYTPSHRTIHENGVTPNIVATLTPEEERKLIAWYRDNALNDAKARDLIKVNDRQLQRAADVLKGLSAYRQ